MLLVALSADTHAQPVPLGDEIVVNTYTTDLQTGPAIATDAGGNFVVVWSDAGGVPVVTQSIRGQRFSSSGAPAGTEFQVDTGLRSSSPKVAMSDDGSFVVTWRDTEPSIVARMFDDEGFALSDAFRVDTTIFDYEHGYEHGYQDRKSAPDVAAANDGRFLVVWAGGYDQYLYFVHRRRRILGQVVDAAGSFVGSELTIGGGLYYEAQAPSVGTDSGGEFVVVWNGIGSYDYQYDDDCGYGSSICRTRNYGVYGRRLDTAGTATTGHLTIGLGDQARGLLGSVGPQVAGDPMRGFIVAWPSGYFRTGSDVWARRYDAASDPLDEAFEVSTRVPAGDGFANAGGFGLDVAGAPGGSFVVVWASGGEGYGGSYAGSSDGSGSAVFARTWAADGSPLGSEVVVNAYTTGAQSAPAVAFTAPDSFVVTWTSQDRDGSGSAIVARQFARAPACGDGSADGANSASDALVALMTAIGAGSCPPCVCDTNDSGAITAADALAILASSVGQPVELTCSPC